MIIHLDLLCVITQEGRVPLDEQTHNIAIELCKECGDTSRAVEILRAMETAGVSAAPECFHIVYI